MIFWLTWPNPYAPNPKPRFVGAFLRLHLTLLGVGFLLAFICSINRTFTNTSSPSGVSGQCVYASTQYLLSVIPVLRAASAANLTMLGQQGCYGFCYAFQAVTVWQCKNITHFLQWNQWLTTHCYVVTLFSILSVGNPEDEQSGKCNLHHDLGNS